MGTTHQRPSMPFVGGRCGLSIDGGFACRCGSGTWCGCRRHLFTATGYLHRLRAVM